jgi:hypothetical protein
VTSRDEVTGEWKRLHIRSFIIRVLKSRRIRWVGHVACMGERRGTYWVLVGKPEGDRLGDIGVDGTILLKRIFKR